MLTFSLEFLKLFHLYYCNFFLVKLNFISEIFLQVRHLIINGLFQFQTVSLLSVIMSHQTEQPLVRFIFWNMGINRNILFWITLMVTKFKIQLTDCFAPVERIGIQTF